MASTLNVTCGSCGYEDFLKNAKKWFTICEEGFCGECEKYHKSMKVTRNHKMISIEDYRQIESISVNHGKKLDLYCKKHDIAVSVVCIHSEHKSCSSSDVISIDEAAENAKQSTSLLDLKGSISTTIDNVKHCIKDREIALKNVDQDEQTIRKTITDTRNLNKYLDELERKLLLDLKSKHENCKSKIIKILHQLRKIEKDVEHLKKQTLQMKRFTSDLQVFLGTRQLNKTISKTIGSLKEEITSCTKKRIEIEVNNVISSLVKEVKQLGEIKVIETMANLQ
ncbi:tripartite motif-containing protein 29-like [Mytilus trossulus]|uniref:tripartite motif-containing protein 29-like n=1 Tax=Mytilus trossulus TaxID=6551 RepID=UPI0030069935